MKAQAEAGIGEWSSEHELIKRYARQVSGELGCLDRVVISGNLLDVCHPGALEVVLARDGIRCFDLAVFAEPLREQMRAHAERVAEQSGVSIEFVAKAGVRKEALVAAVLAKRGRAPGLVHILSAMESCPAYRAWHDKASGRTGLKVVSGKCLHYYFYFISEQLGLCYLRVPTWLPFRLQFYFNGHAWLERELAREGLASTMEDNAFVQVADWRRAQALSDGFSIKMLQRELDQAAGTYLPFLSRFPQGYYWSLLQVEYSWDAAWKRPEDLAPVYGEISRQAILTVKAPEVAKFLGKRLSPEAEINSNYHTRVEGTRVRHSLGPASLKLYDKRGRVLRVECTANDVTFFKHHRKVEHRNGPPTYQVAALKKSIYSLGDLSTLMRAATRRYLEFLAELEDRSPGLKNLARVTAPVRDEAHRACRGFNLFAKDDVAVLLAIENGEYQISGTSNRLLRRALPQKNSGQIGRILKRLRLHGIIKKIGHTYKYYVTKLGQKAVIAALKIKEHIVLPAFLEPAAAT